jgi:hypothetical protein
MAGKDLVEMPRSSSMSDVSIFGLRPATLADEVRSLVRPDAQVHTLTGSEYDRV